MSDKEWAEFLFLLAHAAALGLLGVTVAVIAYVRGDSAIWVAAGATLVGCAALFFCLGRMLEEGQDERE